MAIVAHTTITFFAATTVQLRLPAKYQPQLLPPHPPRQLSAMDLAGSAAEPAVAAGDAQAAAEPKVGSAALGAMDERPMETLQAAAGASGESAPASSINTPA